MTADTFFKVMIWLQGACAIQHAPMKGMIDILFNELKNKFDDKTIVTAARAIAEKEELYGNYPSLRVWLKYCPVTKTERAENDKRKAEFLELVSAIMWLDHMLYDQNEMKKKILALGWRAYNAFQRTGMTMQTVRGYNHSSEMQKNQVLEKFGKAWDEVDDKDPRPKTAPQVMAAKPVLLEQQPKVAEDKTPISINQAFEQAELFFDKNKGVNNG